VQKVDFGDLGDLVFQPWLVTLGTLRKDGTILLSPMWFEWDGHAFVISTSDDGANIRNVRRNPVVTLSIAEDRSFPGRGLEVIGHAIIQPDDGLRTLTRISNKYLGSEVAAKWREARRGKEFLLMNIVPERIRAYDHRDEPMLMDARPSYPEAQGSNK
jgi:PPOX class probable F420-dependent enzyme